MWSSPPTDVCCGSAGVWIWSSVLCLSERQTNISTAGGGTAGVWRTRQKLTVRPRLERTQSQTNWDATKANTFKLVSLPQFWPSIHTRCWFSNSKIDRFLKKVWVAKSENASCGIFVENNDISLLSHGWALCDSTVQRTTFMGMCIRLLFPSFLQLLL